MTTVSLHTATEQPGDPLPDIHIYPVGASHTMPSFAHDEARTVARNLLRAVLPSQDLVVGELAIVWDRRNLRRHLVPDLMVALGAGELDPVYGVKRLQYRIWAEQGPPDLVVEFASRSTLGRDNLGKKEDYAARGVREYVQFDPLGDMLSPRLRVYRLGAGGYEPVAPAVDGAVPSQVVEGFAWIAVGDLLRLRDEVTGQLAPTPEEARAAAKSAQLAAETRIWQERAARQAADRRAQQEHSARQAAQDAQAAAEAQAQQEHMARQAAEDELARLRAELARLRAEPPAY
jgi:Uma2 family endonuclease